LVEITHAASVSRPLFGEGTQLVNAWSAAGLPVVLLPAPGRTLPALLLRSTTVSDGQPAQLPPSMSTDTRGQAQALVEVCTCDVHLHRSCPIPPAGESGCAVPCLPATRCIHVLD
jgi:hypothetical protein